jgi:hypothetical protein
MLSMLVKVEPLQKLWIFAHGIYIHEGAFSNAVILGIK